MVFNPAGRYLIFFALISFIFLGGCASTGMNVQLAREDLARYDALTSAEAVAALEVKLAEARQAEMPFLAPTAFRTAQKSLEEALKELDGKSRRKNVITSAAMGESALEKGYLAIKDVKSSLREELALKAWLEKMDLPQDYGREFEKLVSRLSGLIQAVEIGKKDKLKRDQDALLREMRELQVRSVKHNALHQAAAINEQVRKEGGEKEAPVTFAEALLAYQQAESKIETNPLDELLVGRAAQEALFAARHAQLVMERIVSLKKQVKASPEEMILLEEERLHKITRALNKEDLRDRPVDAQALELVKAVGQLMAAQNERQAVQAELEATRGHLDAAQEQLAGLQAALERERAESIKKDEQVRWLSSRNNQLESTQKEYLILIGRLRNEAGIQSDHLNEFEINEPDADEGPVHIEYSEYDQ